MQQDFTICVLLYGDHADLASRCLHSLLPHFNPARAQLRVGLNQVSKATEAVVDTMVSRGILQEEHIYEASENILKYPMMRRMFFNEDTPIMTPYTMWFDDDSYLHPAASAGQVWFDKVAQAMANRDMVGAIYHMHIWPGQADWVEDQMWYGNKPCVHPEHPKTKKYKFKFATGAWWTIKTEILVKWQWPRQEILHRGGDVMLGELCRQQDYKLGNFREGVAVNANAAGDECKAKRRGDAASHGDKTSAGVGYERGVIKKLADISPPGPNFFNPGF